MNSSADIVRKVFKHQSACRIPKGELWLGSELFKSLDLEDDIDGHYKLVKLLNHDIISFPFSNEILIDPIQKYRYFNIKEILEASNINLDKNLFLIVLIDGPLQRVSQKLGWMKLLIEISRDLKGILKEFEKEFYKINLLIESCLEISIDAIVICDDLAGEKGPLINPKIINDIFSQFYYNNNRRIHDKGLYALFHSCGNISKIITQIISFGFDGLASIEDRPNNLINIKERFGEEITLMGGIDIELLEKEEFVPIELRDFKKRIRTLFSNGGFILCSETGLYSPDFIERIKKLYKIIEDNKC